MTYSIVARDSRTGQFGIAVQSGPSGRWLGTHAPWLEAGIGAIVLQRRAELSYGPRGLELLRSGRGAREVIDVLLADDPLSPVRQLAVVDRHGNVAAHTGAASIPAAGHQLGDAFTVQGNLLQSPTCWPAMARAYEAARDAPFSTRLLRALEAGTAEGGDVRGQQAAAMIIVAGEPHSDPRRARVLDVRVEDHVDAVTELGRLVNLAESYALALDDTDDRPIEERYLEARRRAPEAYTLAFKRGIELAKQGDVSAARVELQIAFEADPRWRTALERFILAGQIESEIGRKLLS